MFIFNRSWPVWHVYWFRTLKQDMIFSKSGNKSFFATFGQSFPICSNSHINLKIFSKISQRPRTMFWNPLYESVCEILPLNLNCFVTLLIIENLNFLLNHHEKISKLAEVWILLLSNSFIHFTEQESKRYFDISL